MAPTTMTRIPALDCVVIGYNETPFEDYWRLVSTYGAQAEAYRDLRLSCVRVGERTLDYVGLLNYAYAEAHAGEQPLDHEQAIKSGDVPNLAAAYLTSGVRRHHSGEYINLFQLEKDRLAALL